MAADGRGQLWETGLVAGAVALLVTVAGCAPAPVRHPEQGMRPDPAGSPSAGEGGDHALRLAKAARVAKSRVGAPYRYGEAGPRAFDCSGLVQFAYRNAGVEVPRTVAQLRRESRPVRLSRLQEGDLLFFRLSGKVRHVAIYLGNDRFVHAPQSGDWVSYASLDNPFWDRHLVEVGRISRQKQ
ncbi:C40 family peptidase [Thiohalorhabdus sp.]|uniref:C40 family peptidase n=1 Tax=Thiohalorhabdus sp. TaxID=3094134 RepID=UPI002FC28176